MKNHSGSAEEEEEQEEEEGEEASLEEDLVDAKEEFVEALRNPAISPSSRSIKLIMIALSPSCFASRPSNPTPHVGSSRLPVCSEVSEERDDDSCEMWTGRVQAGQETISFAMRRS